MYSGKSWAVGDHVGEDVVGEVEDTGGGGGAEGGIVGAAESAGTVGVYVVGEREGELVVGALVVGEAVAGAEVGEMDFPQVVPTRSELEKSTGTLPPAESPITIGWLVSVIHP